MIGCKHENGYTLVEAIVAMGIFVLIATLGAGIFSSILGAQSKTNKEQNVASQLRFAQDVISRDVRQAKVLHCVDPDPVTGKSKAFTISFDASNAEPITYTLDTNQTPPKITKTQVSGGVPVSSPLADIEVDDFQAFCKDIGNQKAFLTLNILAKEVEQPYQVSITPRVGVLQ